jgi:hypothetical protein
MRLNSIFLPLILFPVVLAGPLEVPAQVLGGQVILEGDSLLAGAQVILLLPNGKLSRVTETDQEGHFHFPDLTPGKYMVNVEGPGCEGWGAGPLLGERDSVMMSLSVAINRVPEPPFLIVSSRRPWYEHLQPAGLWPFWERRDYYEALGSGSFFTSADLRPWIGNPVTLTLSSLWTATGSDRVRRGSDPMEAFGNPFWEQTRRGLKGLQRLVRTSPPSISLSAWLRLLA